MLAEWITGLVLRIMVLLRHGQLDRDLDDELHFHLAIREEKLTESGVPAEEARYVAQREFGNAPQAKEANRDLWTFPFLESLWQDIRYDPRQLRRNPGFTAVAVITLALGIGATTAMFSFIECGVLNPLPSGDPRICAVAHPIAGSDLLMRSFLAVRYENLGYDANHVFVANFDVPQSRYKTVDQRNLLDTDVLRRLKSMHMVISAALAPSSAAILG